MNFLSGIKILEERKSPINGEIKVVKSLAFGTYIQASGITQSGGVVYEAWRDVLKKVKGKGLKVKDCLILGLGGGSAAKLVSKFWPEAEIVGVDIDPIMVELGKKYLGLTDIKIVIDDALHFLNITNRKYDLMLVDLYLGDEIPKKFESDAFSRLISSPRGPLEEGGAAVFNRLYYGEKRPAAAKFGRKLEKIFPKVEFIYPEANLMFLCLR